MTIENTATPYKGPSGISRESEWLTNEDIPHDRETLVTVEGVYLYRVVKFEKGRTRENQIALAFIGKKRRLIVNATNRKMLNKLFGTKTEGWYGQAIFLYVQTNVQKPDGTLCDAVRIKDKLPENEGNSHVAT